jgi:3-oxoacyl-[acyl-carrier protein] reductase
MEIKGKKVLVTGGASGIGKCLVDTLVSEGASVCIIDYNAEKLKGLGNLAVEACDITDVKQTEAAIASLWKKSNGIDILVNNAGVPCNELLVNLTPEGLKTHSLLSWRKVIDTNLTGTMLVSAAVAKSMIQGRKKGLIINTSSVLADGAAGQSAYAASKAGIAALTVTWSKELAPYGIRVAGIAPGLVNTKSTMDLIGESDLEEILERTPAGRIAEPQEIVNGFLWIIKNDYFYGRILQLDGGRRE